MRSVFFSVALLVVGGVMADLAQGHGGTYSGPAGGGTPTFGGPAGGHTGGPNGGTTGGGGPAGGATGGGNGGGTTPPGGGGGPSRPPGGGRGGAGPAGRGGGTTQGKAKAKDDDRTNDWDFWWELNDDQFLKLKATTRGKENTTSNTDALLGESEGTVVAKPTASDIRKLVLPAVLLGMKDSFFDARAGAVIAAGKIADSKSTDVLEEIKKLLADQDKTVRESACLGLGMLGSKESIPLLISIMKNEPAARALCGQGTKDLLSRQRAYAAAAIGLIGSREAFDNASVIDELIKQMQGEAPDRDVNVFPALALGIMKSQAAIPAIKKLVENIEGDQLVRAHAVIALGKLGDTGAVSWLVKDGLTDKSTHVQRSAAIALGLLTPRDDEKTVDELIKQSKSAADRAVRNFCLIALGQIGNTKGRDHLVFQLKKGQQHDRTFSAMALGVYGYKFKDSRAEIGKELLDLFAQTKNDSERGAYAVAMGLIEHKAGAAPMIEELKTGGSPNLKGYVALGLGLMGEKSALPQIEELAKRVADLDVQRRASFALGLIQDPEAVAILTKVIESAADNLSALGGAAVALGFIGDRKAVPVLTQMVEKKDQYKDNARAFATVALGILGDKDDLPLLSKIQADSNYLATTEGLTDILLIY